MKITIYHYPKCSTSSKALSILKSHTSNLDIILYCEKGLKKEEILNLMSLLGLKTPKDIIKRNGITYRNLGLAHKNLSEEEWIDIIIQNPKLLQRPVIIINGKAIIGKNEAIVNDLLKSVK